jgi:hypothetical protein
MATKKNKGRYLNPANKPPEEKKEEEIKPVETQVNPPIQESPKEIPKEEPSTKEPVKETKKKRKVSVDGELAKRLAQELGFSDVRALKHKLAPSSKDLHSDISNRLSHGGGIGESFGGAIDVKAKTIKDSINPLNAPKNIKKLGRKVYRDFFSGDDLFSSYMRGRSIKKQRKNEIETQEEAVKENKETGGDLNNFSGLLKTISSNFASFIKIADDLNVVKQNINQLVGVEEDKKKEAEKLKQEKTEEIAKASFSENDKVETASETARIKPKEQKVTPVTNVKKESSGGGILDTIIGMFSGGFVNAIKTLFNPGAILKLFGKIFLIGTVLISLFKGITAGFERWKETGDLKDAIFAGLGAILDFLTFGLFGEDSVKKMFKTVQDFLNPIIDTVGNALMGIMEWIGENVGIPEIKLPTIPGMVIPLPKALGGDISIGPWKLGTIGPYYPFKDTAKGMKTSFESYTNERNDNEKTKRVTEDKKDTEKVIEKENKINTEKPSETTSKKDSTSPEQVTPSKEVVDKEQGEKTYETYKSTKLDLNNNLQEYKSEKGKILSILDSDKQRFPEGVSDDPKSKDYPAELLAIDEKYKPNIEEKTKQVKKLEQDPFIKNKIKNESEPKKIETEEKPKDNTPKNITKEDKTLPETNTESKPTQAEGLTKTDLNDTRASKSDSGSTTPTEASPTAVAPSSGIESASGTPSISPVESASGTPSISPVESASGTPSISPVESASNDATPELQPSVTSVSGPEISKESSDISEGQRMEASADQGSFTNNAVNNSSSVSSGRQEKNVASVYDLDLMDLLKNM